MDYALKEDIIEYESKFLQSNLLLFCVILLLVLKIITVAVSINFSQNIFFADITESSLENFVNQTRQSIGLGVLLENEKLNQAAQLKAENMLQNNYFDHTSPSGVTPWSWFTKAGYNYKYAGENLAIGFFDSTEVFNAWLNSPSHKANIISPNYTDVGTAVVKGFGQNDTIVVVQEFGSQLLAKPVAVKKTAVKPVVAQPRAESVPAPALEPVAKQEVLSQSTNSAYSYDKLLQGIIYGVSLIVIGILLTLIFFSFNVNFRQNLVFRAVIIVVLLSAAALLNQGMVISLIPHEIFI